MDTKDVILIVLMVAAIGFSLYRKYIKKDQGKGTGSGKPGTGSLYQPQNKDDDYEPYSGK